MDWKWYHDREELLAFMAWYVEQHPLTDVGDLLYMMEKPWKYEDEHLAFQRDVAHALEEREVEHG